MYFIMQFSRSIFVFYASTWISLHDIKFIKFINTDPLCSLSVQALSETGRFSSCLFKAPILMSPLCSDWLVPGNCSSAHFPLRRLRKQTATVRFHFFFSFVTRTGNFSNTSVHGRAWNRSKIYYMTKGYARSISLHHKINIVRKLFQIFPNFFRRL